MSQKITFLKKKYINSVFKERYKDCVYKREKIKEKMCVLLIVNIINYYQKKR